MQKSINRQSGFAIGTILLAVVLIAAIVSAIAIASRGSQTQGNQERARVNASTLISQGINFANGFQRLTVGGTLVNEITFNNAAAIADTNAGANCTPEGGTPAGTVSRTTPVRVFQCIYGAAGTGSAITPPRQVFRNNALPAVGFRMNRAALNINGQTAAASSTVLYTHNLTRETCQQINNQVNGTTINSQVPTIAAVALPIAEDVALNLAATVVTGVASAQGAVSAADISLWAEGCFNYTGTAATADADNTYVYIKVLGPGNAT